MFVIRGLFAQALAAFILSFLGALHPVGDSFAVFRPLICLILIPLALLLPIGWRWRMALATVGLAGLATIGWHMLPPSVSPLPERVVIYQKNMFHQNSDLEGLAEDIVASNADFVTLQELSQDNGPLLLNLKETYPYQLICRSKKVRGGTAVLSRVKPLENGVCTRDYASARLTVDLGERVGPIHVTSVHLSWPYPREQPRQLRDLLRDLEALDYPVIIGGDFNMVPWSHALSSVAQASGTRRLGPAQATFQLGFVPLSIDHVFAPYRGLVQTRPRLGSDHLGLRAVVNMANPN